MGQQEECKYVVVTMSASMPFVHARLVPGAVREGESKGEGDGEGCRRQIVCVLCGLACRTWPA